MGTRRDGNRDKDENPSGGRLMILGILIFTVALLVVIMVHESGHFLVAKLFGFKATKFFLGFGPTVWSTQKGETEYGIKALPLGGFVKIIGMSPYEEIEPEDESRSYPNKPRWQRALLLVAGSATHWVVAFVLLFVVAVGFGFPKASNQIARVVESAAGVETAAAKAGLRPGDRIVAIDGRTTSEWDEIVDYIEERGNETGRFTVERDGGEIELEVLIGEAITRNGEIVAAAAPGEEVRPPKAGEKVAGFLGVSPEPTTERAGPIEGIRFAGVTVADFTVRSVTSLDDVFAPVFNGDLLRSLGESGEREAEGAVGLVGAGRVAGAAVEAGMYAELLSFIAGLTIFIGLMNLLPLPPLDGGHLAVLALEKITGKTIDVKKLIPVAAIVIAFFLALFAAVLYLDLARPIKVPF
jgi:membrane-associated protease RseP (regulator of RpoE activity)